MGQRHPAQAGTFHITTNAAGRVPWCTMEGVPEMLIDNLCMSRSVHSVQLHAFCILPDHVHIIVSVGEKGVSGFMHSFKRNSSKDLHALFPASRSAASFPPHISRSAASFTRALHVGTAGVGEPRLRDLKIDPTLMRWQNGFYDELIRDGRQRSAALSYVHGNAVKHGLVTEILEWPWTSLHYQNRLDSMEVWLE